MPALKLIKKITQAKKDNYRGYCDEQFQSVAHVLSQIQPEQTLGGARLLVYFLKVNKSPNYIQAMHYEMKHGNRIIWH